MSVHHSQQVAQRIARKIVYIHEKIMRDRAFNNEARSIILYSEE